MHNRASTSSQQFLSHAETSWSLCLVSAPRRKERRSSQDNKRTKISCKDLLRQNLTTKTLARRIHEDLATLGHSVQSPSQALQIWQIAEPAGPILSNTVNIHVIYLNNLYNIYVFLYIPENPWALHGISIAGLKTIPI